MPNETIIFACYSHDFVYKDGEVEERYGFDILSVNEYNFGPMIFGLVKVVGGVGELDSIEQLADFLLYRRDLIEQRGNRVLGFGTVVTSIARQIANNPQKLSPDEFFYLHDLLDWD